jgi:hypothetical protein
MLPRLNKASKYISGLVAVSGSKYGSVYTHFPEILKYKKDFDGLNLSEQDVGNCFKIFSGCDMGKPEGVNISKLLAFLKVGKSAFAYKVFSVYDIQKQGIHESKRILSLHNVCARNN